jgi:hypothetical protein
MKQRLAVIDLPTARRRLGSTETAAEWAARKALSTTPGTIGYTADPREPQGPPPSWISSLCQSPAAATPAAASSASSSTAIGTPWYALAAGAAAIVFLLVTFDNTTRKRKTP